MAVGCRPSDVLTVPPPAGATPSKIYQNQTGGEGLFVHGRALVFQGLDGGLSNAGVLPWSSLLGDESTWTYFSFGAGFANIDARVTTPGNGFFGGGDQAIQTLLQGRLTLLSAIPILEKYEPASGQSKVGEAFAVMGYAELLAAEDYCAGVPLGALGSAVGVEYGMPLTTDSLLGVAEADFDSAAAHAAGDPTTTSLAAVGLGRARLDRGHFASAATAVNVVPTAFVYNTELEPGGFNAGPPGIFNVYDFQAQAFHCGVSTVADRKGGNGLNYISAQDPRLVLSTTVATTCDWRFARAADSIWYYPVKFGDPSSLVPLATGVEARLIEAEAALQANNPNVWSADLNTLRADSGDTHVTFGAGQIPIALDSTAGASGAAQVDFMFRERAFWLYGTGTRLGDMRRLVRQYGRDQSTVFPTGPYPNASNPNLPSPLPNFGTDVSLALPTSSGSNGSSPLTTGNPNYKGCTVSTKTA